MRKNLEKIFELGYLQYRGKVLGEGPETRKKFKEFNEELKEIVSPDNLFAEWSPGQWRWAAVPWVRVYNKQISPKTGSGVYIVYLFAESGQSVFLTLNQGVSKSTITEIHQVKKDIQEKIDHKDFNVNKSGISTLVDYAESTIFYKEYKRDSLPSDEEMKKDLNSLVNIYKEYIKMKLEPDSVNNPISKDNQSEKSIKTIQSIFFGAPGTGKSHKIDNNLFKDENGTYIGKGIKEIPEGCKFRTTFHPDYDYAQFVGAYKPKKEGEKIAYSFVPQVFAKAYAAAWKQYFAAGNASTANNQVYLVIEEINRGNCAQIFGDIFQLLDRDGDGFSQYSIDADCDFAEWLKKDSILKTVWSEYETKVGDGKLKLPPNLNILATMNTSDQSLYPMDSAFKRRFDWEYVPISFDGKEAAKYEIDVLDSKGNRYLWKDFVENVNKRILDLTDSEDKQLGEFFIKPDDGMVISKERFLGKVMFYLWNEVCKDEHKNGSFFQAKDESGKVNYFTFQDLYRDEGLLKRFMDELLKKDA
jgi:hypothetical protein